MTMIDCALLCGGVNRLLTGISIISYAVRLIVNTFPESHMLNFCHCLIVFQLGLMSIFTVILLFLASLVVDELRSSVNH